MASLVKYAVWLDRSKCTILQSSRWFASLSLYTQRKMTARATTRDNFARSHVHTCQDSEYIKTAEDAWQEAIDLVNTTDGWKEEKGDKNTVRKSAGCPTVVL